MQHFCMNQPKMAQCSNHIMTIFIYLLYNTLPVFCLQEFTGYQSDSTLSSLDPTSSLDLNHIYPSLSHLLSINLSPSIQPSPIHLYRTIYPNKSLQTYQNSVLVVSNGVPGLFQSQISILPYLPPVSDRNVSPSSNHFKVCLQSRAKEREFGESVCVCVQVCLCI